MRASQIPIKKWMKNDCQNDRGKTIEKKWWPIDGKFFTGKIVNTVSRAATVDTTVGTTEQLFVGLEFFEGAREVFLFSLSGLPGPGVFWTLDLCVLRASQVSERPTYRVSDVVSPADQRKIHLRTTRSATWLIWQPVSLWDCDNNNMLFDAKPLAGFNLIGWVVLWQIAGHRVWCLMRWFGKFRFQIDFLLTYVFGVQNQTQLYRYSERKQTACASKWLGNVPGTCSPLSYHYYTGIRCSLVAPIIWSVGLSFGRFIPFVLHNNMFILSLISL